MSAAPQRGRRRAEPTRRASVRGSSPARTGAHAGAHAAEQPSAFSAAAGTTAKCMAAVAVLGALVATGAVVQQISEPASDISAVAAVTSLPDVQAPADANISFPGLEIASSAAAKAPAATKAPDQVKAEADSVQPVTPPAVVDDPAAAQAYAASQLAGFGWGPDQMSCLTQLWQRESEWLTSAENPNGGAYGIAQSLPAEKMASEGADYRTNYQTQIRWGLGYIQGRYGSPCGAWGHSNAVGWY